MEKVTIVTQYADSVITDFEPGVDRVSVNEKTGVLIVKRKDKECWFNKDTWLSVLFEEVE